jgi:hypothetical protein
VTDLLNRLKAISTDAPKPCSLGQIIAGLDAETAEALQRVLANQKVSIRSIHSSLNAEGYKVDRQTISEHRNGYCRCRLTGSNP